MKEQNKSIYSFWICENFDPDILDYLGSSRPDDWGVSICSVDGQRVGYGDNSAMFTIQENDWK